MDWGAMPRNWPVIHTGDSLSQERAAVRIAQRPSAERLLPDFAVPEALRDSAD